MRGRGGTLRRTLANSALASAVVVAVAGCSMNSSVFDSDAYSGAFSKPFKAFDAPDWATGRSTTRIQLGATGPVAPEEFVNADGSCPPEPAPSGPAPAAAAPPAQPVAAA